MKRLLDIPPLLFLLAVLPPTVGHAARLSWWTLFGDGAPSWAVLIEHLVAGAVLIVALGALVVPGGRRPTWSRWGAYGVLAWCWSATVLEAGVTSASWVGTLAAATASLVGADVLASDRLPLAEHLTGLFGVGAVGHLLHFAFALDFAFGFDASAAVACLDLVLVLVALVLLARRHPRASAVAAVAATIAVALFAVAMAGDTPSTRAVRPVVRWEEIDAHRHVVAWLPTLGFAGAAIATFVLGLKARTSR